MASILPFIHKSSAVFDDHVTALLGEAFDAACHDLHDKGQPIIVYELIALRIIDAARNGERDPNRLCAAGLRALGLHSTGEEKLSLSSGRSRLIKGLGQVEMIYLAGQSRNHAPFCALCAVAV